jgi:hypothetical protein
MVHSRCYSDRGEDEVESVWSKKGAKKGEVHVESTNLEKLRGRSAKVELYIFILLYVMKCYMREWGSRCIHVAIKYMVVKAPRLTRVHAPKMGDFDSTGLHKLQKSHRVLIHYSTYQERVVSFADCTRLPAVGRVQLPSFVATSRRRFFPPTTQL